MEPNNSGNVDDNTLEEDVIVSFISIRSHDITGSSDSKGAVDGIETNLDGRIGNRRFLNITKERKRRQANSRRNCFLRKCNQASFCSNIIRK